MTLASIMRTLGRNERQVIEEGGSALSEFARDELRDEARRLLARSNQPSKVTPFAREDGGAYLLADFPDGARQTFQFYPMGGYGAYWQKLTPG